MGYLGTAMPTIIHPTAVPRLELCLLIACILLTLILPLGHVIAARSALSFGLLILLLITPRTLKFPLFLKHYLFFAGWSLFSVMWSINPLASFNDWGKDILFSISYAWALSRLLPKYTRAMTIAFFISTWLLAIVSILGYIQLGNQLNQHISPLGLAHYYPDVGFASTYAVLLYALWIAIFVRCQAGYRVIALLGLCACLIIGLVSLNRIFWLALMLPTIMALIATTNKMSIKNSILSSLCVITLAAGMIASHQLRVNSGEQAASNLVEAVRFDTRFGIWQHWGSLALEHPWLGVGYGRAQPHQYYLQQYPTDPMLNHPQLWHAHNLFLHLILQVGVIGLMAYLFFWGTLAVIFYQKRHHPATHNMMYLGFGLLGAMLIKNTTDYFAVHAVNQLFIGITCYLFMSAHHPKMKTSSNTPPAQRESESIDYN